MCKPAPRGDVGLTVAFWSGWDSNAVPFCTLMASSRPLCLGDVSMSEISEIIAGCRAPEPSWHARLEELEPTEWQLLRGPRAAITRFCALLARTAGFA